jgi:carbon monoxide dehydrogenase subunit G
MAYQVVVPIPVRLVWGVWHDPARLAECVPGLSLDAPPRRDGEPHLTGRLRLRAGGTTVTYRGVAAVNEAEDLPLAVVVTADGVEARGEAPVKAVLTIRLDDEGASTKLVFDGSLTAQGRTAELPPEQLAAAWRRLADRFAAALTEELAPVRDQEAPDAVPARPVVPRLTTAPEPRTHTVVVPAPDPGATRGGPALRRIGALVALLAGFLLVRRALDDTDPVGEQAAGPRQEVERGQRQVQAAHAPRDSSTSRSTTGRSVMIPSTPRSSSRCISAGSSMVQTCTCMPRRCASSTSAGVTTSVAP